jgi:hypothetical protein
LRAVLKLKGNYMKQNIKFILFFLVWCFPLCSASKSPSSLKCIVDSEKGQPLAKFILEKEQIKYRKFYEYDDQGKVSKTITDDGKSLDINDLSGISKRFVSSYKISDDHEVTVEEVETTLKKETEVEESEVEESETPQEKKHSQTLPESLYEKASAFLTFLNNYFTKNSSLFHEVESDFDHLAEGIFGEHTLMLYGYYPSIPIRRGVFGKGEIHDKVRVTFINGILNTPTDCAENCQLFSETHGNVNIHYIFSPTDGFAADIMESAFLKFGYLSPQAKLLAKMWKKLIEEMGGVEGGGKIIHYAHSIGTTDTWAARNLLTPEEEAMISIYTFGSPSLIKVNGFQQVTNYVSVRDGVCMLDPLGFLNGVLQYHKESLTVDDVFWVPIQEFLDTQGLGNITTFVSDKSEGEIFGVLRYFLEENNTILIGDLLGFPLVDHTLSAESYQKVIKERGEEFIKNYGRVY